MILFSGVAHLYSAARPSKATYTQPAISLLILKLSSQPPRFLMLMVTPPFRLADSPTGSAPGLMTLLM